MKKILMSYCKSDLSKFLMSWILKIITTEQMKYIKTIYNNKNVDFENFITSLFQSFHYYGLTSGDIKDKLKSIDKAIEIYK